MEFKPATRRQLKVKLGLMGTAGTGKTWNALAIAETLAGADGRVAVIDSERGRAEAYAGDFKFDHLVLPSYAPEAYIEALALANDEGYEVIIVDSISHEWIGRDGILSSVDRFGGWKDATPRHDNFVDSLFRLPRHVIATMRAKTQYQVEEVERDGRKKQEITKLGVGPVQRDNLEYEFDLLGMCELDHTIRLHKSVISTLPSGTLLEPGDNRRALGRLIAMEVREWVDAGEEVVAPVEAGEKEIGYLRLLLDEEGFDSDMIDNRFKKRRMELGALTPAYVEEQTMLAEARLTKKGVEIDRIRDAYMLVADGLEKAQAPTQADDAADESNEAAGGAEASSEPPAETGTADADPGLGQTTPDGQSAETKEERP